MRPVPTLRSEKSIRKLPPADEIPEREDLQLSRSKLTFELPKRDARDLECLNYNARSTSREEGAGVFLQADNQPAYF